jgi:hypothetical protein
MSIGFGQLGVYMGSFIENEPCALLERSGKKIEYAVERRHRTRGDDLGLLQKGGHLSAGSRNAHVFEFERFNGAIHKAGFLLSGLGKREANIRQHDGKRNAGEASSRAGVEDPSGLRKMTPGCDRIAHMLDGRFFGAGEPREIHVLVSGNDELKMLGRFGDQPLTMGNVRWKNAI